MSEYLAHYKELLKHHVEKGYIRDPKIQKVLESIPLEYILEESQIEQFVLNDRPVMFYYKDPKNARTLSAPHMISMMLSMLELNEQDNVLILGSKGGLIEAAIAKIVNEVFIVEENEDVATITEESFIRLGMTNIWVHRDNPYHGLTSKAKFTKILITGAVPFIPHKIIEQIMVNGIIVFPLIISQLNFQVIFQFIKQKKNYKLYNFGSVLFSPLFSQKIPKLDKVNDFTPKSLLKYAKQNPSDNILKINPFFEEYRQLPNIQLYQVLFKITNEIFLAQSKTKDYNNYEYNFQKVLLFLYNPDKQIEINIKIMDEPHNKTSVKSKQILSSKCENIVELDLKLYNIEGPTKYDITITNKDNFRLTNAKLIIHTIHNESEIQYSIELF